MSARELSIGSVGLHVNHWHTFCICSKCKTPHFSLSPYATIHSLMYDKYFEFCRYYVTNMMNGRWVQIGFWGTFKIAHFCVAETQERKKNDIKSPQQLKLQKCCSFRASHCTLWGTQHDSQQGHEMTSSAHMFVVIKGARAHLPYFCFYYYYFLHNW